MTASTSSSSPSSTVIARCIRLRNSPLLGTPSADDFQFEEVSISMDASSSSSSSSSSSLPAGHLFIQSLYLSVDPYLRGQFYGGPDGIAKNEIITSSQIVQVLKSNSSKFQAGDFLLGNFHWCTHAIIADNNRALKLNPRTTKCRILRQIHGHTNTNTNTHTNTNTGTSASMPLTYHLGILGTTGMTAYQGLFDIGRIQKGEQVFVSGGAGAVGSMVGQIAKHVMGCHVVGTAGTQEKIEWMTNELGFDAGINYKTFRAHERRSKQISLFRRTLASHMKQGIDVYFDNTGGFITEAVWQLLNYGARVIVCGQIANYNQMERMPKINDFLAKLIYKHIRVEGFSLHSFKRYPQFMREMSQWIGEGKLQSRETVVHGFENVPQAFLGLFSGSNLGKMVVDLTTTTTSAIKSNNNGNHKNMKISKL